MTRDETGSASSGAAARPAPTLAALHRRLRDLIAAQAAAERAAERAAEDGDWRAVAVALAEVARLAAEAEEVARGDVP